MILSTVKGRSGTFSNTGDLVALWFANPPFCPCQNPLDVGTKRPRNQQSLTETVDNEFGWNPSKIGEQQEENSR
jgi:hypothetical protein